MFQGSIRIPVGKKISTQSYKNRKEKKKKSKADRMNEECKKAHERIKQYEVLLTFPYPQTGRRQHFQSSLSISKKH